MTVETLPRRAFLLGLGALVAAAMPPGAAEAQGRGWGPDGFGPPGQRGGMPPGHRRQLELGRGLPPGQGGPARGRGRGRGRGRRRGWENW